MGDADDENVSKHRAVVLYISRILGINGSRICILLLETEEERFCKIQIITGFDDVLLEQAAWDRFKNGLMLTYASLAPNQEKK